MATQLSAIQASALQADINAATRTASRIGVPVAVAVSCLAAFGFLLGISTLPRSGTFCTGNCIAYPYTDAGAFFPRDYLWMVPGILLVPAFTVLLACLHFCVPAGKRPFSLIALCFSSAAAVVITIDYFVQLVVMQPSLLHKELDGIPLWTQYNPHGMFIALEDLGYLLLAVGFLFAAAAIPRTVPPGITLRRTLAITAGLAVLGFVGMAAWFGVELALPVELLLITVVWIGLVIIGILASLFLRRAALQA